jgi:DNA-binding NtrC family response regulator
MIKTERLERAESRTLALELDQGKRWILGAETVTIGRSSRCEFALLDPSVSQVHAKIIATDTGWEIVDQHSTNGTLLNGVRTQRAQLQAGSEICIGRSIIRCVTVEGKSGAQLTSNHEALWGESKLMQQLRRDVAKAASTPYPVLIRGESGTGKELVAQAVHRLSRRAGQWVTLNAAAIPEALFESELFGHERGSFTGASARRKGAFEQADRGTLFLDEVGELPLTQQAKLLRVLESGEYRRVGSEQVLTTQCKFVCATHRDVDQMARQERFRSDLLFRMRGHEVHVPPLRERLEDLPMLVQKLCARVGSELGRTLVLEQSAVALLMRYSWPGNVRELLAVLRRAASHAPETRIGPEHLGQFEQRSIADRHAEYGRVPTIRPAALESIESSAVLLPDANHTTSGTEMDVTPFAASAVLRERVRRAKRKSVPNGAALLAMYDAVGQSIAALSRVTTMSRAALRTRLKRAHEEAGSMLGDR